MENIDLNDFDLISPTSIEKIESKPEKFIDINVEDNHTFYVYLKDNDAYILSHNCDGAHITILYIAFFSKYCPSVIAEGRLKKLITPIVCLKDKKENIVESFFSMDEYNEYLKKHPKHGLTEKYYKGLGSWEKGELRPLVNKFGMDKFIQTLEMDDESLKLIDDWISKKKADVRKEYLKQNEFSIFSI